jgi:hypothetical protein
LSTVDFKEKEGESDASKQLVDQSGHPSFLPFEEQKSVKASKRKNNFISELLSSKMKKREAKYLQKTTQTEEIELCLNVRNFEKR